MFSLIAAAHAVEDRLEQALAQHGLSFAKLNVLNKLADAGSPLSLSDIAARLNCVRSNVTQLVDRLEADGLVRREADAADRRSILAVLTPAGAQRQVAGMAILDRTQTAVSEALAGHDRSAIERALAALQ